MHLERLSLRTPAAHAPVTFHRRLTVLAGVGAEERRALVAGIFAGLTGGGGPAVLTVRDARGRSIEVSTDAGRVVGCAYQDGSPAPAPVELVGHDAQALRSLMLVRAPDLGLPSPEQVVEPADLVEARATLAAHADEVDDARTVCQAVDAMREEIAVIDDRIRQHDPTAEATAGEADIEALLRRRSATVTAHDAGRRLVPDMDRLTDRHRSLERRVAVLEASLLAQHREDHVDPDAVRRCLLTRLAHVRGADPDGEDLPLVVDDALVRLQGDAKWMLLDLLDRCAAKGQVVYLTDDAYVGAWARRRASGGTLLLLEPEAARV